MAKKTLSPVSGSCVIWRGRDAHRTVGHKARPTFQFQCFAVGRALGPTAPYLRQSRCPTVGANAIFEHRGNDHQTILNEVFVIGGAFH